MARKFKYGAEGSFLSDPWDPTPRGGGGSDQKAKHGAMTPGPYLSGWTHWLVWVVHVGLEDTGQVLN